MKLHLPGKMWQFKEDSKGNETGQFGEYSDTHEVYYDALHYNHLKIFAKRQEHKWDNWIIYTGSEGDGKSTLAKQDCYVMSHLCKGEFTHNHIAWDPEAFGKLLDESNPGDSVLYDEGITGMDSQRTMSEVNHILKVKSTMCRKKRLFIGICIPSLFDLQKSIAVRRTKGMCKVYVDKVTRGFYNYYNHHQKKMLYILGKKYEDMDAYKGGPSSRFLRWSFIDEAKYEQLKDKAQEQYNKKDTGFNKYKEQRDALINMFIKEAGWTQTKIAQVMKNYTGEPLKRTSVSDVSTNFRRSLLEKRADA